MSPSNKSISNPIDSLLPFIASAITEWKLKNTEQRIKETVTSQLDKEAKQIVLKLLGFDSNYSSYKLDHCNGRAGNSTAGDFIRNAQAAAIKDWLTTVAMPSLTPEDEKNLRASMQQEYASHFRRHALQLAKEKAQADAKVLIEQISQSMQVDNYAKLLAMIEGEPAQ